METIPEEIPEEIAESPAENAEIPPESAVYEEAKREVTLPADEPDEVLPPPPKKRGRPKKEPAPKPAPKPKGRPKKPPPRPPPPDIPVAPVEVPHVDVARQVLDLLASEMKRRKLERYEKLPFP